MAQKTGSIRSSVSAHGWQCNPSKTNRFLEPSFQICKPNFWIKLLSTNPAQDCSSLDELLVLPWVWSAPAGSSTHGCRIWAWYKRLLGSEHYWAVVTSVFQAISLFPAFKNSRCNCPVSIYNPWFPFHSLRVLPGIWQGEKKKKANLMHAEEEKQLTKPPPKPRGLNS